MAMLFLDMTPIPQAQATKKNKQGYLKLKSLPTVKRKKNQQNEKQASGMREIFKKLMSKIYKKLKPLIAK